MAEELQTPSAPDAPYKQARNLNKTRIVIVRVAGSGGAIVERPAIVVRVWNQDPGTINARAFLDGSNDPGGSTPGSDWFTSVMHSIEPKLNTWCWVDEQDLSPEAQAS